MQCILWVVCWAHHYCCILQWLGLPLVDGFKFTLTSFWNCFMRIILRAFSCFIKSFEPSKMKFGRLFIYPLTKLLKIQWMNKHDSFFSCYHIGVCIILKKVVQVNERFMPALGGLWRAIGLLFKKILSCFTCFHPTTHWMILWPLIFINV